MKTAKCFGMITAILIGCGILATGCIRFQQSYPDIKTYSLDLQKAEHVAFSGAPASVCLGIFRAASQYQDRFFIYRTGQTLYESDFYNQLAVPPARMIEDLTHSWLKDSPLVQFVSKSNYASDIGYEISGDVFEMYGDYRDAKAPKAVLSLQWTVSELSGGGRVILFQKRYERVVPIERPAPSGLAEGWSRGLAEALAVFEDDFKKMLVSQTVKE